MFRPLVAPQLTVVSAPPRHETFERMGGTPTLLGWGPPRRRHMIQQQFVHTPAMIRDASGHRRGGPATSGGQTRMWRAKIIDCTNKIYAVLQRQRTARQRAAAAGQRCQPLTERRVQAFDVGRVDHPGTLRTAPQRLDARGGPVNDTTFNRDYPPLHGALDDLCNADIAPRAQPGTPVGS